MKVISIIMMEPMVMVVLGIDKSFLDMVSLNNESPWPTFYRCCKRQEGRCLIDRKGCFSYGESGYMMKGYPMA